jgi:hypothetical protein
MASDSLLDVIAGLVKRDGEVKKEEKKLAREKVKAEKLKADEEEVEDEDEDPVGDPEVTAEQEPEPEAEPEPEEEPEEEPPPPEEEPEDDVDPALVNKVVAIVTDQLKKIMQDVQDKSDAEKYRKDEVKMSGKKEKIDTKPKLEQKIRKGKMNFKEAIRRSVTGTHLAEGYEEVVLGILEDAKIDGPLGYEPFFEKGKLFVEKGSEKQATKVLKQSKDINKVPKIVGETVEFQVFEDLEDLERVHQELATTEQFDVDGRRKGFKEALRRLTYEKLQSLKKEGAAEFMAAASAAKKEGKKKFKFGGKEYPVTIKVDIPLKGEK